MKQLKRLLCCLLAVSVVMGCCTLTCFAAGKTVAGYKNTTYSGSSDASVFVYGVDGYDSSYSTTYRYGSNISQSDFYDKTKTIKYWAAHGNNTGSMWGDANSVEIDIFNDYTNFSWAGGNLEFVFLAACNQLDGLGSNPRAEYARAMIGDSAVRAICGYHEGAPSTKDADVAEKFLEYAETGESVKSSWILANQYWANLGWSTSYYLVLTHSGNVQYSRFEGYPGLPYNRPNASSTTILRFSSTGSNTQPTAVSNELNGVSFNTSIDELQETVVPTYSLAADPYIPTTTDTAQFDLIVETNVRSVSSPVSAAIGEIGHEPLSMTPEEAAINAFVWLGDSFCELPVALLTEDNVEVVPIVMAEVNLDGGPEVEQVVAYSVTKNNEYNGIRILGDHCNIIVDDNGTLFTSMMWADYYEVFESMSGTVSTVQNTVSFADATALLSQHLGASVQYQASRSASSDSGITVNDAELVYAYNEDTGTYQPCWRFEVDGYADLLVNCLNGSIEER